MPAVQEHGIIWQNEILLKSYGLTEEDLKNISYTSELDLPSNLNKVGNFGVSVKTTKNANTVCMGDVLRVFDLVSSGNIVHMTVIQYKQHGNTKKLVKIIEVDITDSAELLFGSVTRNQIAELDRLIKTIPQKRKPTADEHKKMYSVKKSLVTGSIQLNIKCNSQQSRLQCSFNKFQAFMENNPTRIVEKSETNQFRGNTIIAEIESPPRTFKKKVSDS
jgi:hypothetical protein